VPEVAFCVAPKFLSSQTLRSSVPETTAWYSPVVSVSGFKDGSKRTSVWIDGESNGICPVGFNVPTMLDIEYEI
jgi:hypothetical protein